MAGSQQRKQFTENTTKEYYCENPESDKSLRDVIFLYRKLLNFQNKIMVEYERFVKETVGLFRNDPQIIKLLEQNSNSELKLERMFKSARADNGLFFYLDTFFIDLKRIIEFLFRLLARFEKLGKIDFSLENFLKHLSGQNKGSESKFAKLLMGKYPAYCAFILERKERLLEINIRRWKSIHHFVFNETGEFMINYRWAAAGDIENPEISSPEIPLFGKPIPQLINDDMDFFKELLDNTLQLGNELIKERKVI